MDALILAGGENRRIPFLKGFLKIQSRTIIEESAQRLCSLFRRIIISTNAPEQYFSLGFPMVGDLIKGGGPMSGIFSALSLPEVSELFVVACDMPDINAILMQYIISRWDTERDAVIPVFNNKAQPLFGIYAKRVAPRMEKSLSQGKKSMRYFLRDSNVTYIPETEVRAIDQKGRSFVNINTVQDLEKETGGQVCLD